MQIPGISDLLDRGTIPDSLLLLIGPAEPVKPCTADSSSPMGYLTETTVFISAQV